jgi:hypothetical protein
MVPLLVLPYDVLISRHNLFLLIASATKVQIKSEIMCIYAKKTPDEGKSINLIAYLKARFGVG